MGLRLGSLGGVLHALSSSQDAAEQPAGRDPRGGVVGAAGPAVPVSRGAGRRAGRPCLGLNPRSRWCTPGLGFLGRSSSDVCTCVQAPSPCGRLREPDLPGRAPGAILGHLASRHGARAGLEAAASEPQQDGAAPDLTGSWAWRGFELRCLLGHQGPVRPSPEPCGSCPSAGAFTVPSSGGEADRRVREGPATRCSGLVLGARGGRNRWVPKACL